MLMATANRNNGYACLTRELMRFAARKYDIYGICGRRSIGAIA
jgi:hypothetical protein